MKQYLGDSVYADFDGNMVILTTEDGIGMSNRIFLEPVVWEALKGYVEGLRDAPKEEPRTPEGTTT